MEYPINQTAHQRACQDTESFRKSGLSFWAFEVLGAAVFGVVGALLGFWLTPLNSSVFWRNAWPTIGGGLGIVAGFIIVFLTIYLWNLFRAPYKQRNEARSLLLAKPVVRPLSNRNELRGAIASAEQTTIELANKVNALKNADSKNPYLANLVTEADKAYDYWNDSMNELRRQYLIAGDAYEGICIELSGFIWMQIWALMDKIKYPPDIKPIIMKDMLQFTGELASRVKKTLQQVDEISGQVPDRGDSQT